MHRSTCHDGGDDSMCSENTMTNVRQATQFLAVGLLVAVAAGCDLSGQYEARFHESLQSAGTRAQFDLQLFAETTAVTDAGQRQTGVSLRIPSFFNNDSKTLKASDARAQPPFMSLPGLSYTRERQLDDGTKENFLPTYLYLAAIPKAAAKGEKAPAADAVQQSLAAQVAAAFPGAAWSDTQLPTPEGKSITLKRIRVEGPQDFMNLQSNQVQKADGRFDLYFIDASSHFVLIGWRSPKPQGARYFYAASDAAMGTLTGGK